MKLLSPKIELKILKTLLINKNPQVSALLLSTLSKDDFYYPPTQVAFERTLLLTKKKSRPPTWDEIVHDPTIDEDNRLVLQKFKTRGYSDTDRAKIGLSILEKYKKFRQFAYLSNDIMKELKKPKIDFEKLTKKTTDELTKIKTHTDKDNCFFHVGKGGNSLKLVKRVLKGNSNKYIPTGFKTYDDTNHGFARGSVALICGTTGAGKTLLARQIQRNMSDRGLIKTCFVSLEMDEEENIQRDLANISDTSLLDIIASKTRLTKTQKDNIEKLFVRRNRLLKQKQVTETTFIPPEDYTMEEILFLLKPYGYDVIFIDYIGLLGGMDGDLQWQKLGEAVRFAKMFAKHTNTLIIINAQLSEEMVIRYSKALKEHASNMWAFSYSENNIIFIDQQKARQGKRFRFPLYSDHDKMAVRDLRDVELQNIEQQQDSNQTNKNKPSYAKK